MHHVNLETLAYLEWLNLWWVPWLQIAAALAIAGGCLWFIMRAKGR